MVEKRLRRIILETPYAGNTPEEVGRNERYARACMRDCLINHGESPFASHLLYTQPGVLDDKNPDERKLGIGAGFIWGLPAKATVVYTNLGVSSGMGLGIEKARMARRPIEIRLLPDDWEETYWEIVGRQRANLNNPDSS